MSLRKGKIPNTVVVVQGGLGAAQMGEAMTAGAAPAREKHFQIPAGAQQIPPEGMVLKKRGTLKGQIPLDPGIPWKVRSNNKNQTKLF
jgi:hypothetical protein